MVQIKNCCHYCDNWLIDLSLPQLTAVKIYHVSLHWEMNDNNVFYHFKTHMWTLTKLQLNAYINLKLDSIISGSIMKN